MNKIIRLTLSLSLGLTCIGLLNSPSHAQSDPNENVYQNNESSSLYGGSSSFNPMQLIHNSRFSGGRSATEFQEDSSENIVNAADSYHSTQDNNSLMRYWKQQQTQQMQTNPAQSSTAQENTP